MLVTEQSTPLDGVATRGGGVDRLCFGTGPHQVSKEIFAKGQIRLVIVSIEKRTRLCQLLDTMIRRFDTIGYPLNLPD